jgi:hypothetical protein
MKRYAPAPAGGAAPPQPHRPPRLQVEAAPRAAGGQRRHHADGEKPATGADTTFGNDGDQWQVSDTGRLLAMVISADGQAGNGVHLFNADTSVLRVLESSRRTPSRGVRTSTSSR